MFTAGTFQGRVSRQRRKSFGTQLIILAAGSPPGCGRKLGEQR
jgi:hypothetical protein